MQGRVVLGVSGGIAAFKALEVLRELVKAGCRVRVLMTRHATEFVHPRSFAVLSGHPVEVDQWDHPHGAGVDHVELSHWADLLLVVPATANVLGKMAAGIADDALTTYYLAHRRTVLVAPTMNTVMWQQPAVQDSLKTLRQRTVHVAEPELGVLACGDVGEGRLAVPERIVHEAMALLPRRGALAGLRVLVSAGPTRERVDLVRVLGNRSSGRMGVAVAVAARDLGATVTLLHGPLAVPAPPGVKTVPAESSATMGEALDRLAPTVDAVFLAAAVADFRPSRPAAGKMDRREGATSIQLEAVPDLAARVGALAERPYLVVFSAETGVRNERALAKMHAKGADAVILNDVSRPDTGMEAAENEVWILSAAGREQHVARAAKETIAREILLGLAGEMLAHRPLGGSRA